MEETMDYRYNNGRKPVNRNAVARLIIWTLILVLLIGFWSCSSLFIGGGIIRGGKLSIYTYDDEGSYSVGNGELSNVVTSLDIDWIDGDVKIIPSDGDKIVIAEDYDGEEDGRRLRWKMENGELKIKYQASGWKNPLGTTQGKKLTVEIPKAMLTAMKRLNVVLVSADLSVTDAVFEEADFVVVSGRLNLYGRFDRLDVETVSGDIRLEGTYKNIEVEGVSAKIEMYFWEDVTTVDVETVSGDVSVFLPKTVSGFEAAIDSLSGSLRVADFDDLTRTRDYCRYGDGSIKINVDGVSGSLKIGKIVAE